MPINKNKELYWGVILSYLTTFISLGVSLLLTPLIIRLLGQSDYGLYESIGSFVNYLAVLDMGFSAVVTRYTAKYQIEGDISGRNKFLYTCRKVYLCLSSVILMIGIILYFTIDSAFGRTFTPEELSKAHQLFLIVLATTIISIFSQVYKGVLNGIELFIWPRIIHLIKAILSKVVAIAILYYGSDSVGYTVVMLVFEVIACVLLIYKVHKYVNFEKNNMPFKQLKEIFIFSSYLFIMAIVAQIYWQVDKIVLGMCMGTIYVAIYSAALNIENIVRNVSSSIKDILIPRAIKITLGSADSSQRITDFMIKSGRIILIIYGLLIIGLTVLGNKFIYLWLGENYMEAVPLLLVLGYSTLIPTILIPGEEICKTYNKHGPLAIMYLGISILNVVLTFVLVNSFGMMGAAISTGVGLIIGNMLISLLYYKKILDIKVVNLFKGLFNKLVIVFILTGLFGQCVNKLLCNWDWITLVLESIIISVFYVITLYFVGMNKNEKNIANRFIFKISNIFKG